MVHCIKGQDQSQPHRTGWARVPFSSFLPQFSINFFFYFPPFFLISFLILAFAWAIHPQGKALATPLSNGVFAGICLFHVFELFLSFLMTPYLSKLIKAFQFYNLEKIKNNLFCFFFFHYSCIASKVPFMMCCITNIQFFSILI